MNIKLPENISISPIRPLELSNLGWYRTSILVVAVAIGVASAPCTAQQLPDKTKDNAQNESDKEENKTVELSKFVVSERGDVGYRAANTMAGTRTNMALELTPADISVMGKQLMDDLNVRTTEEFATYMMNSDPDRHSDALGNVVQLVDTKVRVRGFSGATVTQDYFPFGLDSDSYNIDRMDLSRGPNAVLYGIGSPGGVLNSTTKSAPINGRKKSLQLTGGSWNHARGEMDLSFPIVRDALAMRVNTLLEHKDSWKEFAYRDTQALALAVTYRPLKNTTVRVNSQRVTRQQLLASIFPAAGTTGGNYVLNGAPLVTSPAGPNPNPSLIAAVTVPQVIYAPQLMPMPFRQSTTGAPSASYWRSANAATTPDAGGPEDPGNGTVIPWRTVLAGPGATSNNSFTVQSVFLDQNVKLPLGELHFEAAYNKQKYSRIVKLAAGGSNIIAGGGVFADPNTFIPGYYQANGDSVIANPGTPLANPLAPNPYAGKMYVEGQLSLPVNTGRSDHYRTSAAYEVNLEKYNKWFGKHTVAGIWQKSKTYSTNRSYREYNASPGNTQLIDSSTNIILRRTYLDFTTPGGLRSQPDIWNMPIPPSPGVNAQMIGLGASPDTINLNTSGMVAGQSSFWGDRISLTGGLRQDELLTNTASAGATKLPNSTNLYTTFNTRFSSATEGHFLGHTKTYGLVVSPYVKWISFFYNHSNSLVPQGALDLVFKPIGIQTGQGTDLGIRFNLLRNRLYITMDQYKTDGLNAEAQFTTPRTAVAPAMQQIVNVLIATKQPLPSSMVAAGTTSFLTTSRETQDFIAKGHQIEVTGRITDHWDLTVNYARNLMSASNLAPQTNGFLAAQQSAWATNLTPLTGQSLNTQLNAFVAARDGTPGRNFTTQPPTIQDAYQYSLSVMGVVNQGTGKTPLRTTADSMNYMTTYRFDNDSPFRLLKQSRIGFGGNYRSGWIIGYDPKNNNAPIKGDNTFICTLMLGKKIRVKNGRDIDVQLNVYNLLASQDMIPYSASAPGVIYRHMFPTTRQSFDLRIRHDF